MAVDREKVVRSGLALLNEVGLDGLTLRRLADRLGVRAPTLYWHVKNKQALLDEMATTMVRDHQTPLRPDATWSQAVTETAHGMRAMLLAHRDGAKMFSGTYLTDDSLLAAQEPALRLLIDAGFSLPDAVTAWHTVYSYVVGFTIEQQAAQPSGEPDARYQQPQRAARLDAAHAPLSIEAGPLMFDAFDTRFARGLDILVAGLAAIRGTTAGQPQTPPTS